MVVDDFDFVGIWFSPFETYSPLHVDANAVLALPVAMQRFQMIARRVNQVRQQAGCMDRPEFAESGPLNRTVPFAALAMENAFRFSITKTFDHTSSVSRRTLYHYLFAFLLVVNPGSRPNQFHTLSTSIG